MEQTNYLAKYHKKYQINLLFAILCLYTLVILFNDYICFLFKLSEIKIITYAFSLTIVFFIVLLLRKKISIKLEKFNVYDIIFFILISLIYIIKFALPDKAFDTLNYHLYLQERPFYDNVLYNFFPSRWINTFSLPLGDRMHYFIRIILGYRLGNLFNYFILTVIYYQIKEILNIFIKTDNKLLIPIFSTIIISTEMILQNFITYYVDLISIPFILGIFLIILNKAYNNFNNILALFCAGIIVSLKISNAFLLIPLGVIYIFKAYKTLNLKTIVLAPIVMLFPIIIYLVNNYMQTRKPSFSIL